MLKDIVKNFTSMFESTQTENSKRKELQSKVEKIKKEIRLKGIKKLIIYSADGNPILEEHLDKESLIFYPDDLSNLITDLQKLSNKYYSNSTFNCILLDEIGIFTKRIKNNLFLTILADKKTPMGALISILHRLEVD